MKHIVAHGKYLKIYYNACNMSKLRLPMRHVTMHNVNVQTITYAQNSQLSVTEHNTQMLNETDMWLLLLCLVCLFFPMSMFFFLKITTNQSLWGLMKGDQGGSSWGLPETTQISCLALEQELGPGTYTSAWPETYCHLRVRQIQVKQLQYECRCL